MSLKLNNTFIIDFFKKTDIILGFYWKKYTRKEHKINKNR